MLSDPSPAQPLGLSPTHCLCLSIYSCSHLPSSSVCTKPLYLPLAQFWVLALAGDASGSSFSSFLLKPCHPTKPPNKSPHLPQELSCKHPPFNDKLFYTSYCCLIHVFSLTKLLKTLYSLGMTCLSGWWAFQYLHCWNKIWWSNSRLLSIVSFLIHASNELWYIFWVKRF